jgi:hypothetical protein
MNIDKLILESVRQIEKSSKSESGPIQKIRIGPHDTVGLFRGKELIKTFQLADDAKSYKKGMSINGITGDNLKIKKLTPSIIDTYDNS